MTNTAEPISGKGQFINGVWLKTRGETLYSLNPANGHTIWQGYSASETDMIMAFDAAKQVLPVWAGLDFDERCKFTQSFANQIKLKRNELTTLIALETGKPLWEAATEVNSIIGKIELSIQAYKDRTYTKQTTQNNITSNLRYKPHGVVVVLGAFNFPAHLSNGHIIPALLAGNTILYKPSELTPAVAEFIMECWQKSAIPEGVINCLQGGAECGKALLAKDIQGVYFTGSYHTGLMINKTFANRPEVILALEMGGNNPLIIGEIDDIKAAVYHTILSCFITAGQRCTCARRVIIPDTPAGETFLTDLLKACQLLHVADYKREPQPFMGPVIRYEHALSHLHAQKELINSGGKSLLEMKLLKDNTGLLSPGIIDMSQVQNPDDQEIFAPLAQIYRYSTFNDALTLANQTRFGLCATLFSHSHHQYKQFFNTVKAGLINWNRPSTGAASDLPFGGVGLSGNHRPSAYFAADYCAYPIASQEQLQLTMPDKPLPGLGI